MIHNIENMYRNLNVSGFIPPHPDIKPDPKPELPPPHIQLHLIAQILLQILEAIEAQSAGKQTDA